MMNARLNSLLVAGGVVLIGIQHGSLEAATPASQTLQTPCILQGANILSGNGMETVINFSIPDYVGNPRIQVLPHPNRVVIDMPGVVRGTTLTKRDLMNWNSSTVLRSRLAQFVMAPEPITRLVLEVAEGTKVLVSKQSNGIQLTIQGGNGAVQARMVPLEFTPAQSNAGLTVANEAINNSINLTKESPVTAKVPAVFRDIPSIKSSEPPISNLSVATLLPTTITAIQEKPAALAVNTRKEEVRGRTLGESQGRYTGSRITIDVKGAELSTFLRIIADHAKLNLVADQDVQGIYDFKFTDTPWDQVLDIIVKHAGLGMEINNGVIRVAKIEKLQKEEDDRKKLEEAKALAGDIVTVTRPLSFAKASEAKSIIEKVLTKRGSIIIDERTNVLIINELPKNLNVIDDLIQQLDVQVQQVQIEARVVEANGNFEKAFGVQWPSSTSGDAKLSVGGKDAVWGTFGQTPSWNSAGNNANNKNLGWAGNNGLSTTPAGELWVSFLSNRFSVNVILQALEKDGKIRIVSNPKVVTQNNKKATILSGQKIPYQSIQSGGAGGANSVTTSFIDANLQLDVTPQITNDGTIIMDLKIEKAEADFSNQVQGTPTILRKLIETQVLVRDGGTAVLGGVYQTTTNNQTQGIPVLMHIPVIGWLFRTKDMKESNAELLIFITPRILKM